MLNIKAGSTIQKLFIGFKTIPIFFAIFCGLFYFKASNFSATHMIWKGIPLSLPWVIYAVIGFEAACSVSAKIKNAERNAPLAVLISFGYCVILLFYINYFFMCTWHATRRILRAFAAYFLHCWKNFCRAELLVMKLESFLHLAIASSTLGAAYGILFSNCWNLHILAQNGHLFFSLFFKIESAISSIFMCYC